MTQDIFDRGLDSEFVKRLKEFSDCKDHWWTEIKKHPELFVFIRGNYLNAYYHGCSLVNLKMLAVPRGAFSGQTHRQYLGIKEEGYITSRNGEFNYRGKDGSPKLLKNLDKIISNIEDHEDEISSDEGVEVKEKSAIHNFLKTEPDVIDVEIAFSKKPSDGETTENDGEKLPRIDILQLSKKGEDVALLNFIEAKLIENGGLVAAGEKPEVLDQLNRYKKILVQPRYQEQIKESYRKVCRNLADLSLVKPESLAAKVGCRKVHLEVNTSLSLLVFMTERLRPNWRDGKKHEEKLIKLLEKDNHEYIPYPLETRRS